MRALKNFEYYIEKGIIKKCSVDIERARSLRLESENTYCSLLEYIDCVGIGSRNSNMIIKMSYDAIMELIRAQMLFEGFVSSGHGAHEAEVSYVRKFGFSESDVLFVNRMRYFRNGIMYYGKVFDKEYAVKVLDFVERIKRGLREDD